MRSFGLALFSCLVLSIALFQAPTLSYGFEIEIEVAPNILNIQSSSQWVTVHTGLAYSSVEEATITLNDIPISWSKEDNQGLFVAKFDMSEVKALVEESGVTVPCEFELTLVGSTTDDPSAEFTGTQTVTIIDVGGGTTANAKFAVSFGPQGLFLHDGNSWTKINKAGPQAMCSGGKDLYAAFGGGTGLYKYNWRWTKINQNDPEGMLCVGRTLYVDFGDSGLHKYEGGMWKKIIRYNVQSMWSYENKLMVNFPSLGLHEYNGNTWRRINGTPAQNVIAVE
jgi:hypothetical protein